MAQRLIAQDESAVEGAGPEARRGATAGLALATLLAALGTSSANVALPTLAEAFGASFGEVQWVVLAYLLATTALIVGAGALGDRIGRRRLLLGGLALFAAASLLCGFAPSLALLIAGRAAQGLGAAAMLALAMAMIGEAAPQGRAASALGLLGTMSALGTALGPSLGGLLISGAGWRAIFLVNVPLALLAFELARRSLPADRHEADRRPFDAAGTALLASALAAYALAMTSGRGGFGVVNAGLVAAAALGFALFLRVEARAASPLIPPSMLRDPRLSAALAMNALVGTVMMATLVVGPFYLTRALGLGPAAVGLVMTVGPAVAALAGVPAGRAADRFGAGRMIVAGLAAAAIGASLLAIVPVRFGAAGYAAPLALLTAGYALFHTANNAAVLSTSPERRGATAGLLNLSRNLGLVTGASAMGAVFALASASAGGSASQAEAAARGITATFALAAALIAAALAVALAAGIHPRHTGRPAPARS